VKPLHLNLASRPYRDYRPLYAVVVALSLIIAFLALKNIETYYQYTTETRTTRAKIEQVDREAAAERTKAADIKTRLARIDTAALDRQTRFVNAKLAERTFSWSELLDRLEDVIAADVRVRTISPSFDQEQPGTINIDLQCEAKTANGMIETLDAMHANPQFKNPFPASESERDGHYEFTLNVDYKPTAPKVVR
jgi:type II secretory pathway component PulM